jgi:hypothetical protein
MVLVINGRYYKEGTLIRKGNPNFKRAWDITKYTGKRIDFLVPWVAIPTGKRGMLRIGSMLNPDTLDVYLGKKSNGEDKWKTLKNLSKVYVPIRRSDARTGSEPEYGSNEEIPESDDMCNETDSGYESNDICNRTESEYDSSDSRYASSTEYESETDDSSPEGDVSGAESYNEGDSDVILWGTDGSPASEAP